MLTARQTYFRPTLGTNVWDFLNSEVVCCECQVTSEGIILSSLRKQGWEPDLGCCGRKRAEDLEPDAFLQQHAANISFLVVRYTPNASLSTILTMRISSASGSSQRRSHTRDQIHIKLNLLVEGLNRGSAQLARSVESRQTRT